MSSDLISAVSEDSTTGRLPMGEPVDEARELQNEESDQDHGHDGHGHGLSDGHPEPNDGHNDRQVIQLPDGQLDDE